MSPISVRSLGQSGLRLATKGAVIYTDPYLTDTVAEREGRAFSRLLPAPIAPSEVTDADWVLVSHDHLDHCDDTTLLPLLEASPRARVIAPQPALAVLRRHGVDPSRLVRAPERPMELAPGVSVTAVPASHPEIVRDRDGHLCFVGFLLDIDGRRLYFAGDTSPHPEIVSAVRAHGDLAVAFLPVNERNHYRDRAGIVGNMSVREAFRFAEELGAKLLVPIHYDMFRDNSVFPEEIELLYKRLQPPFELRFRPESI